MSSVILAPDGVASVATMERELRDENLDRIRLLINEGLVDAYQSGTLTLENFCLYALSVAGKAHPSDRWQANAALGMALRAALA